MYRSVAPSANIHSFRRPLHTLRNGSSQDGFPSFSRKNQTATSMLLKADRLNAVESVVNPPTPYTRTACLSSSSAEAQINRNAERSNAQSFWQSVISMFVGREQLNYCCYSNSHHLLIPHVCTAAWVGTTGFHTYMTYVHQKTSEQRRREKERYSRTRPQNK